MGGREVLRVDQSKPEAGEEFRSLNRLGKSLPLRRLCHAPHSSYRQADMNFETDSKGAISKTPSNKSCLATSLVCKALATNTKLWRRSRLPTRLSGLNALAPGPPLLKDISPGSAGLIFEHAFQGVMMDGLPVGDQLSNSGLAFHGACDSQFRCFVIGAIEIVLIEILIRGATRIEPDHDDHAK